MSLAAYHDLLGRKKVAFKPRGFDDVPDLNPALFPHQRAVTEFLLRAGCGAAFLDTGLGKTFISLEWGRVVAERTGKPVLMLAPLAVGPQHVREAHERGIEAVYLREPTSGAMPPIVVTNYERLGLFNVADFDGVILDESSILKSFSGKTRTEVISTFWNMPYRLAATATPAPNDHMELGNHAEFLGVMASREMLSRWFINDTATASQKWRLKGHAVDSFWDWVASWSRCVALPSDLGFDDGAYVLPELVTTNHIVAADLSIDAGADGGQFRMFRMPEMSATSVHKEKRLTLSQRAGAIADAVRADAGEPWIIWVETDAEADAIAALLPDAVEVRGSMDPTKKEQRLVGFSEGRIGQLITKPSIAGFGLNWQHCARVAFVSLSFSYEAYYQAIRRCWRFGQRRPVQAHIAMSDTEKTIFDTIARKSADHTAMKDHMRAAMRRVSVSVERQRAYDASNLMTLPGWLQ